MRAQTEPPLGSSPKRVHDFMITRAQDNNITMPDFEALLSRATDKTDPIVHGAIFKAIDKHGMSGLCSQWIPIYHFPSGPPLNVDNVQEPRSTAESPACPPYPRPPTPLQRPYTSPQSSRPPAAPSYSPLSPSFNASTPGSSVSTTPSPPSYPSSPTRRSSPGLTQTRGSCSTPRLKPPSPRAICSRILPVWGTGSCTRCC